MLTRNELTDAILKSERLNETHKLELYDAVKGGHTRFHFTPNIVLVAITPEIEEALLFYGTVLYATQEEWLEVRGLDWTGRPK